MTASGDQGDIENGISLKGIRSLEVDPMSKIPITTITTNGDVLKISKDNSDIKKTSIDVEVPKEQTATEKNDRPGIWKRQVEKTETAIGNFCCRRKKVISLGARIVTLLCYFTYFTYCVCYRYYDEGSYILTVISALIITTIIYDSVISKYVPRALAAVLRCWTTPSSKRFRTVLRYGLYLALFSLTCVYLGVDILSTHPQNAQALGGIAALVVLCFLGSYKPSKINWHPVFWGFILQFLFAVLTLRTVAGFQAFKWIGDKVFEFVRLSDKGTAFVFGDTFKHNTAGFFIDSAGVIVFFNSFLFLMDHLGALEFVVLKIGKVLALCLETGPVESVVAAANIFIGLSEAPLLVRPYLPTVTRSELHAIMTCGFASISGAFMAMFIKAGAPANHLLTASVISAPAGLAISKLMYPEVETVNYDSQSDVKMRDTSEKRNALQAISEGATFSIKLVGSIMVNMLAFVSMMNLVDHLLVWIGARAGVDNMSFDLICSYILYPLSYIMGVPVGDCGKVGSLIGIKMIATPFVAYRDLGKIIQNRLDFEQYTSVANNTWHWSGKDVILDSTNQTLYNGFLSERAEVITTYALCGISAFPAIGFSMGTLIPMSPTRKKDVMSVLIRAFIAGNLANFATAAVAGVLFTPIHT
ncbi:unnamed protein product [Candidula unifasciata]|uniref:Sodium/nucleoside cotransporter n=1 Tax=Candidula unifasciata TaxID=100452 RepID=A0A8S3YU00_9EUPU|nr:unnamed protein product [Candidula unifasciata]